MAITTSLTYADGDTLDVDGHNKNIYTTRDNAGILSTANGRLDSGNLNTSFACDKEHIWPGEVFRGHQEFQYETASYFSDVSSDTTDGASYTPVAGCALRVYMPYDVTFALWQWSFHLSIHLPQLDQDEGETADRIEPIIKTRTQLNGSTLSHTVRASPLSAYYLLGSATSQAAKYEHYLARPYDMAHMATSVSAGWHELQVQVFLENFDDEDGYDFYTLIPGSIAMVIAQNAFSRASFGIRNARVLTVL